MNRFLILSVIAWSFAFAEDEFAEIRVHGNYSAPFKDGIWFVGQGGDTINVNVHMAVSEQEFGVDLVKSKNRSLAAGDGKKMADYYSFGETVISPCGVNIIDSNSGAVDNEIGNSNKINEYGNYVIIDAGNMEYVVLAHFKCNSLKLKLAIGLKLVMSWDWLGTVEIRLHPISTCIFKIPPN